MLSMMIFCHKKISFREFAYIYSMTVIITVSLSTIIQMKNMDASHPAFYFVLTLALPWLADAGAYFAGVTLGKHKLCPEISPKKTIEGAIGGTIVCVLATCGLGWLFADVIYKNVQMNYINLAVISLNLIPGHGGVLDRFDSVVFVSPFLYIIMGYLPVMGV